MSAATVDPETKGVDPKGRAANSHVLVGQKYWFNHPGDQRETFWQVTEITDKEIRYLVMYYERSSDTVLRLPGSTSKP